jgi:heat shock protein HspQ
MGDRQARFRVGQLVHHRLFDYRGVIYDVDPTFQGRDDWYEAMARTRPPKDRPWYHVLVHDAAHTTYVAERNLEPADGDRPIRHPAVDDLFAGFDGTRYVPRGRVN